MFMKELYFSRVYRVDTSKDQRFIIDSPNIDSLTLEYLSGPVMLVLEENIA